MTLRLSLIIEGDADEAKKALEDVKRGLENTHQSSERTSRGMQQGFEGARGKVDALRGGLGQIHGLLLAIAGGSLTLFIKGSAEWGDSIARGALQLGIAVGKLQEYRVGAALAGAQQDDLTNALTFFHRNLGDNSNEVTGFQKALGQLGLRFADLKAVGFDKSLALVSDRLSQVTTTTLRNNIAQELFSRTSARTITYLAAGSSEMAKLAAEARHLGLVLSDETVEKSKDAADEFTKIGTALRVAGVNMAVAFLPALVSVRDLVTDNGFQGGLKSLAGSIGDIVKYSIQHKSELELVAGAIGGYLLLSRFGPAAGAAGAAAGAAGVAAAIWGGGDPAAKAKSVKDLNEELRRLLDTRKDIETAIQKGPKFDQAGLAEQWQEATKKIAAKRAEIDKAGKELSEPAPTKLTVTKAANPLDALFPQVDAAIRELRLKRGEMDQEFKGFGDGFGSLVKSLNLAGVTDQDIFRIMAGGAGALKGQLRDLNIEMLKFQGAQMRLDLATPEEKYNRELEKTNVLLAAGAVSQDTFNRKVLSLRFPQLTQLTNDWASFTGQIDQAGAGSLNTLAGGLADVTSGTKSTGDAFKQMGQTVTRTVSEMIFRMLLAITVGRALKALFGAIAGGGSADSSQGYDEAGFAGAGAPAASAAASSAASAAARSAAAGARTAGLPPGYRSGGGYAGSGPIVMPPGSPQGAWSGGAAARQTIQIFPTPGSTFEERRRRDGDNEIVELHERMFDQRMASGAADPTNRERYGVRTQAARMVAMPGSAGAM